MERGETEIERAAVNVILLCRVKMDVCDEKRHYMTGARRWRRQMITVGSERKPISSSARVRRVNGLRTRSVDGADAGVRRLLGDSA